MDVASLGRGVWPFSVETAMPAVHINLVLHSPSDTASFPLSLSTHAHIQTNGEEGAAQSNTGFYSKYKHIPTYTGLRHFYVLLLLFLSYYFACFPVTHTYRYFLIYNIPVSFTILYLHFNFPSDKSTIMLKESYFI